VSKPTSHEETVTAIVDALKPWQQRWCREEILADVETQIQRLRETVSKFFSRDSIIRTREDAREITKTIAKLQQQLSRASPELKMRFSHRQNLPTELALLSDECKRAVASALTEGRKDQVKEWCAQMAHVLTRKYSDKEPTSGSSSAPFRNIAGLLYEAVRPVAASTRNHRKVPDLKRACDDVLKAIRKAVQFAGKKSSDL